MQVSLVPSAVSSDTEDSSHPKMLTRTTWPLVLLVLGFPLWWLLGLSAILPILLAVPLLWQLAKKRSLATPKGFGWWLLFLVWMSASLFLLWANAPGAVPGGGFSRVLVFGYRFMWYLSCTVMLLWIINTKKEELSNALVVRLMGWMFIFVVAGGLLGVLAPRFEVTSLVELLLPESLRSNSLINSIAHPAAASLTNFLGRPEYRPIAPFAFANSWGSNFSLFLPFFILGWFSKRAGWRRVLGIAILALATIPVVQSMNRGLWASLGLGLLILLGYIAVRGPQRHRFKLVAAVVLTVLVGAVAFSISPLADTALERLDNAHSNERRSQLLTQTVLSTAEGSPVAGFGSTRDIQGSFASIAGGGTPDCPACEVPPLGTQGHIWLVIFSQGLVGAAFFLLFFLWQAWHFWRVQTALQLVGMSLLCFFALQMFIYDTLGMPLLTIMLGLGLMWRERYAALDPQDLPQLTGYFVLHRRQKIVLLSAMSCALALGVLWTSSRPAQYIAQTSLLLAPTPMYLSGTAGEGSRSITVDTEAALVLTQSTLDRVNAAYPELGNAEIRSAVSISATPNSRVLHLNYASTDKQRTTEVMSLIAEEYLAVRNEFLAQRKEQVLRDLQEQLMALSPDTPEQIEVDSLLDIDPELAREIELRDSLIDLTVSDTRAGEILRATTTSESKNQPEVVLVSLSLLGLLPALALQRRSKPRKSGAQMR
ncbi:MULTISPECIES: hypothetical protein [unclassified Arthrobacter]|uniref:hypothetical protein n=1 Tax=unclassified Arthrobacter TaxID=235627 RepID=UPI0011B09120|nr:MULTISPECIES: hypothetical protein [unclassified Arthrobacter]